MFTLIYKFQKYPNLRPLRGAKGTSVWEWSFLGIKKISFKKESILYNYNHI